MQNDCLLERRGLISFSSQGSDCHVLAGGTQAAAYLAISLQSPIFINSWFSVAALLPLSPFIQCKLVSPNLHLAFILLSVLQKGWLFHYWFRRVFHIKWCSSGFRQTFNRLSVCFILCLIILIIAPETKSFVITNKNKGKLWIVASTENAVFIRNSWWDWNRVGFKHVNTIVLTYEKPFHK